MSELNLVNVFEKPEFDNLGRTRLTKESCALQLRELDFLLDSIQSNLADIENGVYL